MVRGQKEQFNPVQINAKSGFVLAYECTTCWVPILPERTENHAKWHERQQNAQQVTIDEGNQNASQENNDIIGEAKAEVKRIEDERKASQRTRRDPRNTGG